MINKNVSSSLINKDIVVIGGGLSGICAAIAAARNGKSIALIQDRPVLGGNSSSEIRVWTCGATAMGYNRFSEETGIIGEILLENLYRNPEGNPYYWDTVLFDFVNRESNIELFCNTTINSVHMQNDCISSVLGYCLATEQELEFKASIFIDCTGDGTVGYLAGAEYMVGRESRNTYHESFAPKRADSITLGSSILFYVKNVGKPVPYIPPGFAYKKEDIEAMLASTNKIIDIHKHGCDLWWIEYGGQLDTIYDNIDIYRELQKLVYGIWDYIKNSGKYASETLTLEWVGSIPGKRESRRLKGHHVLTQNDILEHRCFEDAVCGGGWPIDMHPSEGIFSKENSCQQIPVSVYQIPLRCLFSLNIQNLMFAGRNISVSHVALASTRVMKTCAVEGQAVGTAAAIALSLDKLPYSLTTSDIYYIQQRLIRDDMWIPDFIVDDPENMACKAKVTASGTREFSSETPSRAFTLNEDIYILMPSLLQLECFSVLADVKKDTELIVEFYQADAIHNYDGYNLVYSKHNQVKRGSRQWIDFYADFPVDQNLNLIVRINSNDAVSIYEATESCCGVIGSIGDLRTNRTFDPCFRVSPKPILFGATNIIDGIARPDKKPHIWISEPIQNSFPWVRLTFEQAIELREIQILFNPNLSVNVMNITADFDKINLRHFPKEMVKSFTISIFDESGRCVKVIKEENNRQRRYVQCFNPVKASAVQINIMQTYGSQFAQIFEVRIY